MTNKLAKWNKEAEEFFEKAEDKSVVLDLVISYACASQTGEGFEELVNTINSESIKRKVKKVVITDTSYLYRHPIPSFSGYCDVNLPTEWYLKNKKAIEDLTVDFELKSWFAGLQKDGFNDWYKQIKKDFVNDIEFKNAVIEIANAALLKSNDGGGEIGRNIDFILEETAYTCLNFKNVNMVYPMPISTPVKMAVEKYNLNVRHLSYTISWHAQENKALVLDRNEVNNEIIKFITRDATNVNFFVMGKNGDIIYKNSSLSTVVTEWNAKDLDKQTWDNSLLAMKEKKQMIFEETDKHKDFLSVKAPLVINGKIEGVIGLALDITDRRKVENLQNKLKMQKELFDIAKQVAHDINSPISSLKMIQYISSNKLSEQENKMLDLTITSINNMAKKLIEKCRSTKEVSSEKKHSIINKVQEEYISLYSILTIVDCKRYQYQDDKIVTINFVPLATDKSVFIRGNFSNFQRMMNNLIDNAIEAGKREQIIVDVSSRVLKDNKVEIIVKDNGKGMPKEMAENLMKMIPVGTTKEGGHGIGTEQIISTIKMMKGEIKINTQEGVGTEFILRFERTQTPEWFDNQSEPEKDSTLIVLSEQVYKY